MKKLIAALILTAALLAGLTAICFAADGLDVIYDTALSEDGSTLELTVTAVSAVGLQSGDLSVAYDESKYEFTGHKVLAPGDIMVAAGKAVTEDGLLTCSFITAGDAITADMCDEKGNLPLVVYTLKVLGAGDQPAGDGAQPVPAANVTTAPAGEAQGAPAGDTATAATADPANDFFMYVVSAKADGKSVQVPAKGAPELAAEHDTGGVTVPANNGQYQVKNTGNSKQGLSWYVIVLIFVAVIAGAAGIAFAVRKKDSADGDASAADKKDEGQ